MRECRLKSFFFLLKRLSLCLCIWHKKKSNPVTEQYTSKYNSEIRFQIAALWQSSRNVLSSFNSNIYAFFVSFFYQGVNSFEKLWKWVLCKTYGLKKCNYMIFTKMKFWSEMKGQVLLQYCVRRSISSVTKKKYCTTCILCWRIPI